MSVFLLSFILVLHAKLVKLEASSYYAGEYDLDTIRAHESMEKRKCEHLPYPTVFTVSPGFKSFKFTCIVRKENGCSRDKVYNFRIVENRIVDHLEEYEAFKRAIVRSGEQADRSPPICIFEYSVKTKIDRKEVYHHCEDGWYYTENAEKIRIAPVTGASHIGRRVPMCFKAFSQMGMNEARAICTGFNAVVSPTRNSMEEMAFIMSYRTNQDNLKSNTYTWLGVTNRCEEGNTSWRCFYWDYDSTPLDASQAGNAGQHFEGEDCLIHSSSAWDPLLVSHKCVRGLQTRNGMCAKEASLPSTVFTPKRVQYHCDDDSWVVSRRSEVNGIPLCYKGSKVEENPAFPDAKAVCFSWGAVVAPVANQGDFNMLHRAMDHVFPQGDLAGKYVYIDWKNINLPAGLNRTYASEWDGNIMTDTFGQLNWSNESASYPLDPKSMDEMHYCIVVDLGNRKWREWYCKCETWYCKDVYPTRAVACAKPANQFIY